MTVEEAAGILDVTEGTILRYCRSKKIRAWKLGKIAPDSNRKWTIDGSSVRRAKNLKDRINAR